MGNKNLSGASAVWGAFTVGKPKADRDCLHMHFHCETAGAQHKVATKSARHVIPVLDIEGVLCSSAMTTHQVGAVALLPECSVAFPSIDSVSSGIDWAFPVDSRYI